MRNFWICFLIIASIGVYTKAQFAEDEFEDYDFNSESFEDVEKQLDEYLKHFDDQNGVKVDEEIQKNRQDGHESIDPVAVNEPKDNNDRIDDYQYEDNRSKLNDEEGSVEANDEQSEDPQETEKPEDGSENRVEPDEPNTVDPMKDYALLWGDDSVAPLPVPEAEEDDADKSIVEETKKILEEDDTDAFEEELKKIFEDNDSDQPKIEDIVEETKQILEETDDSFNNNDENTSNKEDVAGDKKEESTNLSKEIDAPVNDDKSDLEEIVEETKQILSESDDSFNDDGTTKADESSDDNNNDKIDADADKEDNQEDTIESAYADLNADLEKLLETLDKLKEDVSSDEVNSSDLSEGLDDADNIFTNDSKDNVEVSEELVEDNNDDDIDLDKLLQDILSEDDMKSEDINLDELEPLTNDALDEPNPEDDDEKDVETLKETEFEPVPYLNDALIDNEKKEEPVENTGENEEMNASVQDEEVATKSVDDLSSVELEDLVKQFAILHSEDLDVHAETFDQDIAPVHIHLKLDEPTIITSPNHPNPYPTNNIVDWVLEGEGVGIELNITSFAVNGALGDYLLIKPGGVDDSGNDGLLFTYRLNSERRYRFTDVDRVFMRFESKLGMMFFRGFSISAKMIAPISDALEPIPEPEAVLAPPHSTTTLILAVSVRNMTQMKEEFRLTLADMAEQYINDNNVDPGVNSTVDVTQITSIGLCPISWPDFEDCSIVTFGISLEYEDGEDLRLNEDDLQEMWRIYSKRDPFAYKLSSLGITEYTPPDSSAMTAWLVIAAGVVISMAMLAFVLWRYSCFEDYTRMRAYSDTDSIHNEKRNLDLYPTPHQTLPPLYAENEYKWQEEDSTRVDMGGFANGSYARDNMYDFESDEEVVTTRDRNGAVTARDVYSSNV